MRSLVLPFGRVCGNRIGSIGLRTYSCKLPKHPDPQCMPVNPKCYYIEEQCDVARDYLSSRVPLDTNMVIEPCCVPRLAHRPCVELKARKLKKERPPFRSMWEPPCKPREQPYCPEMLPRFDEMFYHPSNKNRCFQRTWIECPPIKQRLRKVCCLDGIDPPEVQRRVRPACPPTCIFDYARMQNICKKVEPNLEKKCTKTFWPCCKPGRCPPECKVPRKHIPCIRLRTPSKSFSETRLCQRQLRQRECSRLPPSICACLMESEYRKNFKIRPMCS